MKKDLKFYKIGMGMIVLAFICWSGALLVPFTDFSIKAKAGIITGILVVGEVVFWIGLLLAGKEGFAKIKSYFNPKNWRKKIGD